jgi:hypothetical protein
MNVSAYKAELRAKKLLQEGRKKKRHRQGEADDTVGDVHQRLRPGPLLENRTENRQFVW